MRTKWTVVVASVAFALTAPVVPAAADPGVDVAPRVDQVHLVVSYQGPVLIDDHSLVFRIQVDNLGPATATQLQTRQSVLLCPTPSDPIEACTIVPPVTYVMRSIAPGVWNAYGAKVPVPITTGVTVRTTVEVSHVLQQDVSSTIGGCDYGRHPQDACITDVTVLPT